ncbi:MAG TPA: hypothetical protein VFR86_04530 [Burkholderiaceae bacterium]|nr:hypothetical protein [Burkholderiaceae bacterium]
MSIDRPTLTLKVTTTPYRPAAWRHAGADVVAWPAAFGTEQAAPARADAATAQIKRRRWLLTVAVGIRGTP